MKKFQFRLSSALRVREVQLETVRVQLQRLLAERQQLELSILALESERSDAIALIHRAPDIGNADLRALSGYLIGAQHRNGALQVALGKLDVRIAECRQRVSEAERGVKLLERLREKKYAEWVAEADRELELTAQEAWTASHFPGRSTRT